MGAGGRLYVPYSMIAMGKGKFRRCWNPDKSRCVITWTSVVRHHHHCLHPNTVIYIGPTELFQDELWSWSWTLHTLPLADVRSGTPPLVQPLASIALIVSGLPTNSFSAATDHLKGSLTTYNITVPLFCPSKSYPLRMFNPWILSTSHSQAHSEKYLGLISWRVSERTWTPLRDYALCGKLPRGAWIKLGRPISK